AERFYQYLAHELLAGQPTHAVVEPQAYEAVHPIALQRFELLSEAGQTGRRRAFGEKLARRRLERQQGRRQAVLCRTLAEHTDHLLMAEMDAVERPNGQHAATLPGTQVIQAPNELHRGPSSSASPKEAAL